MNQRVQIKPLAQRSSAGSPRREIGATESAKSSKQIQNRQIAAATPMLDGFNAMRAEVKAAAERLGFDVSKPNWSKLIREESETYPSSVLEGNECLDLIPKRARARLRALELTTTSRTFFAAWKERFRTAMNISKNCAAYSRSVPHRSHSEPT
jgi:hypothetical protein